MRGFPIVRRVGVLAAALALSACGRSGDAARTPSAKDGRLVAAWQGGARFLDAPAQATYCAGDSLLLILAIDDAWGAGLLLHGRFPVDSARSFAIRPSLGEDGTATAAFRSVADSVHRAVMGLRGSVRLDSGGRASGSFEVGAAPLPGRSEPLHIVGAFSALPTTDTSATCSAWARNP